MAPPNPFSTAYPKEQSGDLNPQKTIPQEMLGLLQKLTAKSPRARNLKTLVICSHNLILTYPPHGCRVMNLFSAVGGIIFLFSLMPLPAKTGASTTGKS